MAHDPLTIIAESYQGIHESTQILAQVGLRLETTQRLALRLQGFALVLIGLSLFFAAYVVWQHGAQGQEHTALMQALRTQSQEHATLTQALLTQSQAMAAQTQALVETLQRLPTP